jgi:hypothetical protein
MQDFFNALKLHGLSDFPFEVPSAQLEMFCQSCELRSHLIITVLASRVFRSAVFKNPVWRTDREEGRAQQTQVRDRRG